MENLEPRSLEILENVTQGLDFTIPSVDFDDDSLKIPPELATALQKAPDPITLSTLTEKTIDGSGVFDVVMTALKNHLKEERQAGRITGAEYTSAYIAMMQYALQYSVQFLLGKDNAYYQALGTQAQAITANINAYTTKVKLAIAQAQAHQAKAQYAVTVSQLGHLDQQRQLVYEQTEQAHAQVSDTRLDGETSVSGYTGNQNKLLQQQVIAFKKDAIVKGAKVFTDSFATQLSMSTATVEGTGLDSSGIGKAVAKLQESIASDT